MSNIQQITQGFLTQLAMQQQLDEARKNGDTAKVEQLMSLMVGYGSTPSKPITAFPDVKRTVLRKGCRMYYFNANGDYSFTLTEDTIFEVEAVNEKNAVRKFDKFKINLTLNGQNLR